MHLDDQATPPLRPPFRPITHAQIAIDTSTTTDVMAGREDDGTYMTLTFLLFLVGTMLNASTGIAVTAVLLKQESGQFDLEGILQVELSCRGLVLPYQLCK